MRARSLHVQGRTFSEPRSGLAHSEHRDVRRARQRGVFLLGYFFLATQEEVTGSPAGRDEAPDLGATKKAKALDSGFRLRRPRNDELKIHGATQTIAAADRSDN